MGILLFGLYPDFEEGVGHGLNKAVHILYQSSSRALWAMALAFMVFSCTMGKGGEWLFLRGIPCNLRIDRGKIKTFFQKIKK